MRITRVTLIGANGKVGPHILQALLRIGSFQVTVITRKSSKSVYGNEVHVVQVDDDLPADQLTTALSGQDALVIAFAGSQAETSIRLADAAFEAGVTMIIPNDFGSCDSSDPRSLDLVPLYKNKKTVRDHLVKLSQKTRKDGNKLYWTSLITGHFFDFGLKSGLLSIDLENRKARMLDGGYETFSASILPDIGFATAKILQNVENPRLTNKLVYVHSIATTQRNLLSSVERATGTKFSIEECSSDEYINKHKMLLENDRNNHDIIEELVSVEGIVNADWAIKGDRFVNDLLGMPCWELDDLVKEALSEE